MNRHEFAYRFAIVERVLALCIGFKSVVEIYEIKYMNKMNNPDLGNIIILRNVIIVIKIVIIIITTRYNS